MTTDFHRVAADEDSLERRQSRVEVLAPTLFEYLISRISIDREHRVRYAGMRLSRWRPFSSDSTVIVCGLAGSLVPTLRPGHVFIPETVSLAGGDIRRCHPDVVAALQVAARELRFEPASGKLLTSSALVTGDYRARWAALGYSAVDMEAGLVPDRVNFASVRVILDAPARSISPEWVTPATAIRSRQSWSEFAWLAHHAPIFARRAARIADAGMERFLAGTGDGSSRN